MIRHSCLLSLRRAFASGHISMASILCTWYDVSFSSTPSFYVSRILWRAPSIKKACRRPYSIEDAMLEECNSDEGTYTLVLYKYKYFVHLTVYTAL